MALKLYKWDTSELLDSEETISEYLALEWEDGTDAQKIRALETVAKARNMTEIAKKMGISRKSLYEALSGSELPSFDTVEKLLGALGVKIAFVSANTDTDKPKKSTRRRAVAKNNL